MIFHLPQLFGKNMAWIEKQQNTILSAAAVIMVSNVLSATAGFAKQWVFNSVFLDGTERSEKLLNALWVSFQIPDTMFQLLILGALSAAFIPIFSKYKKEDEQTAFRMSSIMMNVLLLTFVIVAVPVFIFAEPITRWRTGHEFTPEQIEVVTNLTRIMLLSQFFFAISSFMSGILQSYQRFIVSSLSPVLYNVGILIGVLAFSPMIGVYAAGVGTIIGAFLHMIVQVPSVLKLGYRYKFTLNMGLPGVKEFFQLMPPRALAIGANEIRKLFLGFFATSVAGNLTYGLIQMALMLIVTPIRFFGVPIGQAALPFLSDEAEEKDRQVFRQLVLQSLHQIAFFSFPASVLLLVLRVPLVRLAFGTDEFTWQNTLTVGRLVAVLAISIGVQAMAPLVVRAFYALKDTKTPLIVSLLDVIVYLGLCSIFVFGLKLGILGIGLAITISALLEFLVLLLLLDYKVKGFNQKGFWVPQIKMTAASFLMAVFLYLPFRILDELVFETSRTIELIVLTVTTSTIGVLVYIYFAALFDIKELTYFTQLVTSFGPWQKTLAKTPEVLSEAPAQSELGA
ncbi:MAG TPA: murein biosynthesis integral membrane protein MurJ [Vitreimonas sp.]|nr:murein biosynthesis integral membrane protein MurJ [Vitreimonas sp.]